MSAEDELEAALLEIYDRAKSEENIIARRFKPTLRRHGAREAAKRLLRRRPRGGAPGGFDDLMAAGRPDLTLESVVLRPHFRPLFTQQEQGEARRRLGLAAIAQEISLGAIGRSIGELQNDRTARHNLTVVPSLFDGRTIWERFAFHVGGLSELQFNIGFEEIDDEDRFRHGVALSLQPTRNLPDIRVMIPRIEKFNEFLRTYPDEFADLSMWHHTNEGRSQNYPPGPIPERLVKTNSFIFLGVLQPAGEIDIDRVLDDFDRLMPLYDYVEGAATFPALTTQRRRGFEWSPGNKARVTRTSFERKKQTVDKALRHNVLQDKLFRHLEKLHGESNTSGEQDCGKGTPIDVAIVTGKGYTYYEIKTDLSARSCIREALGQLMEYSFWPGTQQAIKLVVVGEPPLDADARKYLNTLRKKFSLPVHYQQFKIKSGKLIA